jgi:hypothetical protein
VTVCGIHCLFVISVGCFRKIFSAAQAVRHSAYRSAYRIGEESKFLLDRSMRTRERERGMTAGRTIATVIVAGSDKSNR